MRDKKTPVYVKLKPGRTTMFDSGKSPNLPSEVLTNIVQHVLRKDLFKLQRLSRQFFTLASAQIYARLDFRFTTTDARDFDMPVTRFSDALQSIITSDYDYAQHIRILSVTISPESAMNALMMARFLWGSDLEPSKMLNAALLLLLKKAKAMESFVWGVPVELNGLVYQALHQIPTLRKLGVFLGGNSIVMSFHQTYGGHPPPPPGAGGGANAAAAAAAGTVLSAVPTLSNAYGSGSSWSKRASTKNGVRYNYWKGRRTLSKFDGLKTLILNDISDLECLDEIAGCLRASSASLRSLSLSLSSELAQKARKPNTTTPGNGDESDPDLTESENEGQAGNPPVVSHATETANAAEVQKDKVAQDAILARIFSLQEVLNEGRKVDKHFALSKDDSVAVKSKGPLSKMMLKAVNATIARSGMSSAVAKLLIQNLDKALEEASSDGVQNVSDGWGAPDTLNNSSMKTSTSAYTPSLTAAEYAALGLLHPPAGQSHSSSTLPASLAESSHWLSLSAGQKQALLNGIQAAMGSNSIDSALLNEWSTAYSAANNSATAGTGLLSLPDPETQTMFDTAYSAAKNYATPGAGLLSLPDPETPPNFDIEDSMDVDMDHPDESLIDIDDDEDMGDNEDEGEMGTDANEPESNTTLSPRKRARFGNVSSDSMADGEAINANPSTLAGKGKGKERETSSEVNPAGTLPTRKTKDELIQDYVRATHGLQLEELTLYLIPLKASIVARAIDLTTLKRVVLLDVGPQAALWNLLQRLSTNTPGIGFESIHTDDVSHSLLKFLSTTSCGVKELYLHRRKKSDTEPEPSAGPVDITAIFKLGLKKHFRTLTHLMIKNDHDESWDIDDRAVRFLSMKGKGLVELAVLMRLKTMHTLIQHISNLTSLRALHFLNFRTSGNITPGPTLLEIETASMISDALAYRDNRKLRYLAISERYAKIETPAEVRKRCKPIWAKKFEDRNKILTKSKVSEGSVGGAATIPEQDNDEDSWDENGPDYVEMKAREVQLRWSTRFWEIKDVKIFEKIRRTGKLHS